MTQSRNCYTKQTIVASSFPPMSQVRHPLGKAFPNCWLRLDVARFTPDTLDTQSAYNCLCTALTAALLTETPAHASILEETMCRERSRPNGHLTVRFGGDLREGGVEEFFFVTATDTKLLARQLGINIFQYFAERGDGPPCWITYSGNHLWPGDGGVYLAVNWLKKRKVYHSFGRRSWVKTNWRLASLTVYFLWVIAAFGKLKYHFHIPPTGFILPNKNGNL